MKQELLRAIIAKKNYIFYFETNNPDSIGNVCRVEYLPAIDSLAQARLEQCKIYYNELYIANYLYLSENCVSGAHKTVFYFPETFNIVQQRQVKRVLEVFRLYLEV